MKVPAIGGVMVAVLVGTANAQFVGRPIPLGVGGSNIGEVTVNNNQSFCCGGTLGAPVIGNADGNLYILGSNHVIGRLNLAVNHPGQDIIQPSLTDLQCSQDHTNAVANFSTLVPIKFASGTTNVVDVAIAKAISGDVSENIAVIGGIAQSTVTATIGLAVQKVGWTTGRTLGTVQSVSAIIDVVLVGAQVAQECNLGGSGQSARFINQIEVGPFPNQFFQSGNSGSLVVTQEACPRAVGVAIGIDDTNGYTIVNPFGSVLKALNVKMAGTCTPAAEAIAQAEAANPYAETNAQVNQIVERHRKELIKIDGVVGINTHIGERPGEIVIELEVEPDKVDAAARVAPSSLEGVPVEVSPVHTGVGGVRVQHH
jgi:hypothetical protein